MMERPPVSPWMRLSRALAPTFAAATIGLGPITAAAKDTVLGMEMIPRNMPNSTIHDVLDALRVSAGLGGHSSFIWHWSEAPVRQLVIDLVPGMHGHGLKSMVQVGAIFLRAPDPPDGLPATFADPQTRARYIADVEAIARARPNYLILATEINLLDRFNRPEFEHFTTLYTQAYDAVKAISPMTQVGASFLYTSWFAEFYVDGRDLPGMLQPLDFIAFTSYPLDLITEGWFASASAVPAEWLGAARLAYPDARIAFSELAWPSKHLGTPESQADFTRQVPRLVSQARPELVTWAVLHDNEFFGRHLLSEESVQFLESLGVDIDALFSHFNGMGLRDGFGNPKPAYYEAAGLVFPPPP